MHLVPTGELTDSIVGSKAEKIYLSSSILHPFSQIGALEPHIRLGDVGGCARSVERVKQNAAPFPSSDSTQIRPSCRSTIFLHNVRPIPVPVYSCLLCRR